MSLLFVPVKKRLDRESRTFELDLDSEPMLADLGKSSPDLVPNMSRVFHSHNPCPWFAQVWMLVNRLKRDIHVIYKYMIYLKYMICRDVTLYGCRQRVFHERHVASIFWKSWKGHITKWIRRIRKIGAMKIS